MLVRLARDGTLVYGEPRFMLLYALGGLGPTIGAYVAVLATRRQAPLREFHQRLFRWRLAPWWYVVAAGLPVVLGIAATGLIALLSADVRAVLRFTPWYTILPVFFLMIAGGGLEELGWRGVAQPEAERAMTRARAALIVGAVWATWHGPLFVLPGVVQHSMVFPIFAVRTLGLSFLLAWLYGRTRSILLCVIFHAASNTIVSIGFMVPHNRTGPALAAACLHLVVGALVLLVDPLQSKPGLDSLSTTISDEVDRRK